MMWSLRTGMSLLCIWIFTLTLKFLNTSVFKQFHPDDSNFCKNHTKISIKNDLICIFNNATTVIHFLKIDFIFMIFLNMQLNKRIIRQFFRRYRKRKTSRKNKLFWPFIIITIIYITFQCNYKMLANRHYVF